MQPQNCNGGAMPHSPNKINIMPSLGKKFLSAFIELDDAKPQEKESAPQPVYAPVYPEVSNKFREHFNTLFSEANLPGPGYYEFSKMTEAMQVIADEKARFCAAFAGLHVQGLDKQKLLSSTQEYLQILDADATAFHNTINAAISDKVEKRRNEVNEAQLRIQQLSQEIVSLQQRMALLTQEIAENETKINSSAAGYTAAMADSRNKLLQDIEKIKQHIL
jgi:hypothetical protein